MMSISTKSMLDFLDNFNYLEEKYLIRQKGVEKRRYSVNLFETFLELEEYERIENLGQLQKLPTSYVGRTLNSVYGTSAQDSMKCFDRVKGNIIGKFLNINGLELLFNEHYYDFEWDMHLEMNFEDAKYAYYRDHMEHQIRNMYMMLEMLEKYGFIESISKYFSDRSISKVSDYVFNRHKEYVRNITLNSYREKLLFKCSKLYYEQLFFDYLESEPFKKAKADDDDLGIVRHFVSYIESKQLSLPKEMLYFDCLKFLGAGWDSNGNLVCYNPKNFKLLNFKSWVKSIDKQTLIFSYINDYSIKYIIKSAAIISALFHDLSYPLCFFMNMQRRVGQYLPSMNAFTHNVEADIDKIISILRPSLLFVLVSEKEIRSKLVKNQKKYDHGVFSAISLLLSFYESGKIHQLSIDRQIAIELAALAIYNHNFQYNINDEDAKEYFRPVFSQNPISFLLKMCDEMQEWDRRYFEISKVDENIFCPNCGSPIIRFKEYHKEFLKESLLCRCCDEPPRSYKKSTFFPHRNMYTVTTCHSIDVNRRNNNLIFKLNYRLIDLLHMSQVSSSYASYRAQELNKLKVLMLDQKYSTTDCSTLIQNVYLDYTMSANPIFLKAKILIDYLKTKLTIENCNVFQDFYVTARNNLENIYENWLDDWHDVLDELVHNDLINAGNFQFIVFEFFKERFIDQKSNPLFLFFSLIYNPSSENPFVYLKEQIIKYNKKYIDEHPTLNKNEYSFIKSTLMGLENSLKTEIDLYIKMNAKNYFCDYIKTEVQGDFSKIHFNSQNLWFYFTLSGYIGRSWLGKGIVAEELFLQDVLEKYPEPTNAIGKKHREVVTVLLKDIYKILINQVDVYTNNYPNINRYIDQYESEQQTYHAIERYNNPVNWYTFSPKEYKSFSDENPDFYSDLLLFEILGEKLTLSEMQDDI